MSTLPTMDHFSIDLETLGTRCDAPILSIGVAQFDIDSGKLGATFYHEVEMESALRAGRVSADTLAWWVQQSERAKRVFERREGKLVLQSVLFELTSWMRAKSLAPIVWGNGATFDIGILEYAYSHHCVGLQEPWHFTNIRDMRTLVHVADFNKSSWPFPKNGTAHNALDDAVHQAGVISAAWRKVRNIKAKPDDGVPASAKGLSAKQAAERTAAPAAPIVPVDEEL